MFDEYVLTELRKLSLHSYGIILWVDDNEKDVYLSDIVEAIPHDGNFDLFVRGEGECFDTIDITETTELDAKLYKKTKEIALEKSRLYKNLFVDSTQRV